MCPRQGIEKNIKTDRTRLSILNDDAYTVISISLFRREQFYKQITTLLIINIGRIVIKIKKKTIPDRRRKNIIITCTRIGDDFTRVPKKYNNKK